MTIAAQIAALDGMSTPELAAEFERVVGKPPRYRQPKWMTKRIAHALQVATFGGLPAVARAAIDRLNADVAIPSSAPVRPAAATSTGPRPGTVLQREWRGQQIRVEVTTDGFIWNGTSYGSLSAVAFAITGARWNGRLFFNLVERKSKA